MDDDLAPAPSAPPFRGNSREYLLQRLERDGHHELLVSIAAGELSVYAAACEVGYVTRPTPSGNGSPNARKRREWAIRKAYQGSARADTASVTPQASTEVLRPPPNGRSAPRPPIDLAAVIAEWEEAQKPAPSEDLVLQRHKVREPAPAVLPEPVYFPVHPAVPCTSCSRPEAAAALRQVLDVYVAASRGEPHQTGSTLPRACCQRMLHRRPDIRAMIA
jgi:hypothetical protein